MEKTHYQVINRKHTLDLFAPLDDRHTRIDQFRQIQIKRLRQVVQPVDVEVVELQSSLISIGESERGTGHSVLDAQAAGQALSEARLACTKIASQDQDVSDVESFSHCCRQLASGVGADGGGNDQGDKANGALVAAGSVRPVPVTPDQIRKAAHDISPNIRVTPNLVVPGSDVSEVFDRDLSISMKLEYIQHSGTFKARGAANFISTQEISTAGIVAASGGNHGAAVAWAARRFGHQANIFVPTISAPAKVARLRDYGAIVHQVGDVYADALKASVEFQQLTGATSIHAYDDPFVMAGAGTCGLEFEEQSGPMSAILVACGGGGLSGGLASWFGSRTEIVVCETDGTATYARAKENGGPVDIPVSGLAADALGATRLGEHPWAALSAVGATSVIVSDDEVASARSQLWKDFRILVEPAAAAPLAALLNGRWTPTTSTTHIGLLLCGANTSIE